MMLSTPNTRELTLSRPLDLRMTLGPLRMGKGDPTCLLRFDECYRTSITPDGGATLHLLVRNHTLLAEAWGPGAEWIIDQVPILVGELDDTSTFRPDHALVADLAERTPGLRMGATHRVVESLVGAVCAAGVSRFEAKRAHRQLVERFGQPAPGPVEGTLFLPPAPRTLAGLGTYELLPLGLEAPRADVIRRAAARAAGLEALVDLSCDEAERRLRAMVGVGVRTASVVRELALGDPDAVPVGDPRAKHVVAYAFTGERRGSDAQMLELLEPFRGHRGRVLRLLRAARLEPDSSAIP